LFSLKFTLWLTHSRGGNSKEKRAKKKLETDRGLKRVMDGIADTKFHVSKLLTVEGWVDLTAFPLPIHIPVPKSVAKSVSTFYSPHTSTLPPTQQTTCPH
jgi:hypothetical protein